MSAGVDVGLIADLRWGGGTSTALANEVLALRHASLTVAIVFLEAGVLTRARPPDPKLLAVLESCGVPVLSQGTTCRAEFVLAHHPGPLQVPPARPLPFCAGAAALVAHHPVADREGTCRYDYARALGNLRASLRCDATIWPVSDIVRSGFTVNAPDLPLLDGIWPNLIDLSQWPPAVLRDGTLDKLIVGRHARPDPLKWPPPDAARVAYPESNKLDFRMLGVNSALAARFDPWPANWQALPFAPGGVSAFLQGLDAYAYFHAPEWIEAFGYGPLEAMATGLPVILPHEMERVFGDGPIYVRPEAAEAEYDRLRKNPEARRAAGQGARAAAARFDVKAFAGRYRVLPGISRAAARGRVPRPRRSETVLAVTSNGVGVGHLSRQVALAQAAPIESRTVLFTLSKAAAFAARAGLLVEQRPYHAHRGIDTAEWNRWFCGEILEAIRFYRPDALMFDGNVPYRGLCDALGACPDLPAIWMRRGLWRHPVPEATERGHAFDLILEPGELAASGDPGHARAASPPHREIGILLSVPARRRLSRKVARRLLELPEEGEIILLAPGAGANFDMDPVRIATLSAFPDAAVLEPLNPVAAAASGPASCARHVRRSVFPLALYLAAFDAAVLAAGYNAYHEALSAALPTLFVPNVAAEMDLQEVRADLAARYGWALSARADDPYALARGLAELGRPDRRRALTDAARTIEADWAGADEGARLVSITARRIRGLAA